MINIDVRTHEVKNVCSLYGDDGLHVVFVDDVVGEFGYSWRKNTTRLMAIKGKE